MGIGILLSYHMDIGTCGLVVMFTLITVILYRASPLGGSRCSSIMSYLNRVGAWNVRSYSADNERNCLTVRY